VLVLCTGMGRSGSTWSFNVVKQLLAHTSVSVRAGYLDAVGEALAREGPVCDHLIVKTHVPDAVGLALIKQRSCRTIYTYREPLDSILSAMESLGQALEPTADAVKASLDLMRFQVEAGGVRSVWYDDIVERPQDVVRAIADYLELALPDDAIAGVAARLSRDNVRRIIRALGTPTPPAAGHGAQWDGGILFSRHHVRANPGDPARAFGAAQIAGIAKRLHGYVGADAALRAEIRALGMVDNAPLMATSWPEPVVATPTPTAPTTPTRAPPVPAPPAKARPVAMRPVEALPVEALPAEPPAIETPPAEALSIEAPPAEALSIEALPVEAAPVEAPSVEAPSIEAAPAEALPADLAAEPPEAPSIEAASEPPEAPPTEAAPEPADSPPPKPATAPKPAPYDPSREAHRRALARDLLRSLGHPPSGKPRSPRADR
jgi:hypothetical protein